MNIPIDSIKKAAKRSTYALEFTHSLYRYPASMSPHIAREIILATTKPGDTVLDPFCGGGTTAIEALAHGRRAICSDINPLACFVTRAKAQPINEKSIKCFENWIFESEKIFMNWRSIKPIPLITASGKKLFPKSHALMWCLMDEAKKLSDTSARRMAMLFVLRVCQLCLDCRKFSPNPWTIQSTFRWLAKRASNRIHLYNYSCNQWENDIDLYSNLRVINSSVSSLYTRLKNTNPRIKLILTSPPYPGVHILYNKWQIHGRKEVKLPYYLLGLQDGHPESYFTFGSRKESDNNFYFSKVEQAFAILHKIIDRDTIIAQIISFTNPKKQLYRYRKLMKNANFDEIFLNSSHRLLSRIVPNRRWYNEAIKGDTDAREYLLFHRPIM